MNQEPLLSAFTRLRDNLLSMSRHILQNEDDASDAIQEAFCRLWPIRNKIKSEKEAAALTVTTTRNKLERKLDSPSWTSKPITNVMKITVKKKIYWKDSKR